tara:strand:- start:87 stop:350 length:264 start_codon:yes stop_codon:yes gene_type:complete
VIRLDWQISKLLDQLVFRGKNIQAIHNVSATSLHVTLLSEEVPSLNPNFIHPKQTMNQNQAWITTESVLKTSQKQSFRKALALKIKC